MVDLVHVNKDEDMLVDASQLYCYMPIQQDAG